MTPLQAWVQRFLGFGEVREGLYDLERAVRDARRPDPPPPPPPFMAVLLFGTCEGQPTTMGTSGNVGDLLELRATRLLHDVTVIVFTDLRRVVVRGIFYGTDLMQAGLGPCPMARIPLMQPGILVQVHAEVRP